MSESFVLSTLKYLLERNLFSSSEDVEIELSSDILIGDTEARVFPLGVELGGNITLWFEDKQIYSTDFCSVGESILRILPSKTFIPSGTKARYTERVGINNFAIINYSVAQESYAIIETSERLFTQRQGYSQNTFTIPLHIFVSWFNQDISLNQLVSLTDEVMDLINSKLYIPGSMLPLKVIGFSIDQRPNLVFHPNVPDNVEPVPVYISRTIKVTVEDYYDTYSSLDVGEFWLQLG